MELRNAKLTELDTIYNMYKSVIGTQYCTWSQQYPGKTEIDNDYKTGNLYVLVGEEKIIGAITAVPENELSHFTFWQKNNENTREISRVIISKEFWGQGMAKKLVQSLISILEKQGCQSVHLSVAALNIPAYKTYISLGFTPVGESDMYGSHFILCEKLLNPRV